MSNSRRNYNLESYFNEKGKPLTCPNCGSIKTWKDGLRKSGNGVYQRHLCRDCGYRFSGEKIISRSSDRTGERQVCVTAKGAKNLIVATTKKRATGDISKVEKLFDEFTLEQRYLGRSESTIRTRVSQLRKLVIDGADLYDPDSVKEGIYKQNWVNKRKNNGVDAYNALLKIIGKEGTPPKYQVAEQQPFIPTEKEVDALIAGTGKKTSTLLQLLKETAIRIGGDCNLTWDDIDFVSGVMRVTPEKGSNPRVFRVSKKLINMLASVKATRYIKDPNRIFTKLPKSCRKVYTSQRDRIAAKLQNPRLKKIGFHTFRHWKGTRVYHETKDILYTKQFLGHKSLINTMKYIHLEEAHFKERNDKYVTKVARTVEEAIPLLELGYEEATDFDGVKIFRKVKSEVW